MDDNKLMNRDQAARRLGLSARTVYTLARRGDLPAIRVGRVWRFDPQELDAWRRQHGSAALVVEPDPVWVEPLSAEEIAAATGAERVAIASLAEQRQTNRLLAQLLNRGGTR